MNPIAHLVFIISMVIMMVTNAENSTVLVIAGFALYIMARDWIKENE